MALYYILCAMAKSKAEFGSIKKDIDGEFVRDSKVHSSEIRDEWWN